MPKINLLPTHIAELIAAGEVVERPTSVIKEMVENSIDAGATRITVEIQRGGIMYMRITDNGCGISNSDVPLAFMRHATSKISKGSDLDSIATLGFRGEALAATSAVSKIEMLTCGEDEEIGTHYCIEGGKEVLNEASGCPKGTTIIIRELFYNTPARMKFLKKDVSEGNAVAAVIDRLAISHPEIAFKLIREGKQTLQTSGDGKLKTAIYSVLGRDYSNSLIEISPSESSISVSGYICKPVFCRQSRAGQYIFLNGRLVHSGTVTAAVEQAYKNSAMVGKFPAFVLNLSVPFETVDVNVHPAKTEIRFSDEKRIFDAVFYAVKSALSLGDTRPVINLNQNKNVAYSPKKDENEYTQQKLENVKPIQSFLNEKTENKISGQTAKTDIDTVFQNRLQDSKTPIFMNKDFWQSGKSFERSEKTSDFFTVTESYERSKKYTSDLDISVSDDETPTVSEDIKDIKSENKAEYVANEETSAENEPTIRLIGEAFKTYIAVERDNSIFLIDKHAAHERIIYNKLKREQTVETQQLLTPLRVTPGKDEYDALLSNTDLLLKSGFEIEDFGNFTVLVRAVPSTLLGEDITSVITEVALGLTVKNSVDIEVLDNLYHTVACKAAIKAGYNTSNAELLALAEKVLSDREVMYCPHGRPVAYEIRRHDLEKQFGRIQ